MGEEAQTPATPALCVRSVVDQAAALGIVPGMILVSVAVAPCWDAKRLGAASSSSSPSSQKHKRYVTACA